MSAVRKYRAKRVSLLLFTMMIIACLVNACENEQKEKEVPKTESNLHMKGSITFLPLSAEGAEVTGSHGWLDNDTIIYSVKEKETYRLLSFNISSKAKQELFSTNEIISGASVSPNRKYILIHSSGSNENANIRILSPEGKRLYEASIPSAEINFSWSLFSEGMILIESFDKDWMHATYVLDVREGKLRQAKVPKPFAEWHSADTLAFLDWNEEDMQMAAPLKQYDMRDGTVTGLADEVISFGIAPDVLLVIREAETSGEKKEIEYRFYGQSMQELSSFRAPVRGMDMDWVVPFFDIVSGGNAFFTFSPSAELIAGQNGQNDQLIRYDWMKDEKTVIVDDVEEAPLMCSPDARKCLYGSKLEMLIE